MSTQVAGTPPLKSIGAAPSTRFDGVRPDDLTASVEQFIKSGIYLRAWSPKTVRTYRQAFSSLQQSLRSSSADADGVGCGVPTKARLEAWIIWLKEKGVSAGGCNMYIRTVNSYLSWLHEEQLSPSRLRLKLLPDPKKPLVGLSNAEMRLVMAYRPSNFYQLRTQTLATLLADTGLRITEALTLENGRVDFAEMTLMVLGKGNKWRHVPFSVEGRKALWKLAQARERRGLKSRFVFCTDSGSALTYRNAYRDIKYVCGLAGVNGSHVHPHAFRHFFAVSYIRNGGDIYRLSRILGHASISTTQLYLRSMGIEHLQEGHSQFSPLGRL